MLAARLRLAEALAEAGRLKDATTQYRCRGGKRGRRTTQTASCELRSVTTTRSSFGGMPLDQSVALLTEAEAKIAPDDDKQRCLILARLARAHLLLGDAKKSESYDREGTELARRLGDRQSLFTLFLNRFLVPRQVNHRLKCKASCRSWTN